LNWKHRLNYCVCWRKRIYALGSDSVLISEAHIIAATNADSSRLNDYIFSRDLFPDWIYTAYTCRRCGKNGRCSSANRLLVDKAVARLKRTKPLISEQIIKCSANTTFQERSRIMEPYLWCNKLCQERDGFAWIYKNTLAGKPEISAPRKTEIRFLPRGSAYHALLSKKEMMDQIIVKHWKIRTLQSQSCRSFENNQALFQENQEFGWETPGYLTKLGLIKKVDAVNLVMVPDLFPFPLLKKTFNARSATL